MRKALFVEDVKFKAPAGFADTVNAAAAQCQTTLSEFIRQAALAKAKSLGIEMPMVEVEPSLKLTARPGTKLILKVASARTDIRNAGVDE